MKRNSRNHSQRAKRALRVRKGIRGSAGKPRLCVVKTNIHLEAQLIDDVSGRTLVGLVGKRTEAKKIGATLGEKAKKQGVEEVVFDRGASKYHGVVASLADGAREAGLRF